MMRALLFTSLMTLSQMAGAQASGEAFQGLPWGATEAEISKAFGAQIETAECTEMGRSLAEASHRVCAHPSIPAYRVNGVEFKASFHLDATTRRLVAVDLYHLGDTTLPGREWASYYFNSFNEALETRYGKTSASGAEEADGIGRRLRSWEKGGTRIRLMVMYATEDADFPMEPSLSITYRPIGGGDSGKL